MADIPFVQLTRPPQSRDRYVSIKPSNVYALLPIVGKVSAKLI